MMDQALRSRRSESERRWQSGVAAARRDDSVRPEVLASWERSARSVVPELAAAPVAGDDVARRWTDSRLGRASRAILDDLRDMASGGDMMAAITDESVTIAWLAGGRTMSRRAERVHFEVGGCWAEDAVGTNALAVAQTTAKPFAVFSAEHYAAMVHDWVCYSAPILDPFSGRSLGVIDLSTVWDKAHPALLTTVSALARCVEYELQSIVATEGVARTDGMVLRTLGAPTLEVDGTPVPVTRRQMELLTVLAMNPGGLTLDELTGRVYGDQPVSPSTVKAELSHLRHRLGGRIASRPYRLVGSVTTDHGQVLSAIGAGDPAAALHWYRGPMLPFSESPEVEMWRDRVDVAIRDAALHSGSPELLLGLSDRCPDDGEIHRAALDALAPGDVRRSIMAGRLTAASRPV